MITFENVKKIYSNGTVALNGINLRIDDGEFVFITGHSGAGKSTMIHLLTREDVASEGILKVGKDNLKKLSRRRIPVYRRKIGVVFQDFRLIPSMTVYDNVAFAMRVTGGRNIRERVHTVLDVVGLSEKTKVFPNQLSGGEQQRVALARAIVNKPSLIIADEPTGNVDPEMSIEIMKLLSSINKLGITVVVVTHEQRLVRAFKKREIRLEKGSIAFDTAITEDSDENSGEAVEGPKKTIKKRTQVDGKREETGDD